MFYIPGRHQSLAEDVPELKSAAFTLALQAWGTVLLGLSSWTFTLFTFEKKSKFHWRMTDESKFACF